MQAEGGIRGLVRSRGLGDVYRGQETLLSLIEKNGGEDPLLHVEGFNYDRATIALNKRTRPKLDEREPIAATIPHVGADSKTHLTQPTSKSA
mgnify:CR=1 FL=1